MLLLLAAAREDHRRPFLKAVRQRGLAPEPDAGMSAQAAVLFCSVVPGSAEGKHWDFSSKETATSVQLLLQDFEEGAAITAPSLNPCWFYSFKRPFCRHNCA